MEYQPWRMQGVEAATILVVEDEAFIRFMAADFLRECGWNVVEANCAASAVGVLECDSSVALVFSDIQMPGVMDGIALANWVRTNRPGVRIMLTSGAVRDVDTGLSDSGIIPKPYSLDLIGNRVEQLLTASI